MKRKLNLIVVTRKGNEKSLMEKKKIKRKPVSSIPLPIMPAPAPRPPKVPRLLERPSQEPVPPVPVHERYIRAQDVILPIPPAQLQVTTLEDDLIKNIRDNAERQTFLFKLAYRGEDPSEVSYRGEQTEHLFVGQLRQNGIVASILWYLNDCPFINKCFHFHLYHSPDRPSHINAVSLSFHKPVTNLNAVMERSVTIKPLEAWMPASTKISLTFIFSSIYQVLRAVLFAHLHLIAHNNINLMNMLVYLNGDLTKPPLVQLGGFEYATPMDSSDDNHRVTDVPRVGYALYRMLLGANAGDTKSFELARRQSPKEIADHLKVLKKRFPELEASQPDVIIQFVIKLLHYKRPLINETFLKHATFTDRQWPWKPVIDSVNALYSTPVVLDPQHPVLSLYKFPEEKFIDFAKDVVQSWKDLFHDAPLGIQVRDVYALFQCGSLSSLMPLQRKQKLLAYLLGVGEYEEDTEIDVTAAQTPMRGEEEKHGDFIDDLGIIIREVVSYGHLWTFTPWSYIVTWTPTFLVNDLLMRMIVKMSLFCPQVCKWSPEDTAKCLLWLYEQITQKPSHAIERRPPSSAVTADDMNIFRGQMYDLLFDNHLESIWLAEYVDAMVVMFVYFSGKFSEFHRLVKHFRTKSPNLECMWTLPEKELEKERHSESEGEMSD